MFKLPKKANGALTTFHSSKELDKQFVHWPGEALSIGKRKRGDTRSHSQDLRCDTHIDTHTYTHTEEQNYYHQLLTTRVMYTCTMYVLACIRPGDKEAPPICTLMSLALVVIHVEVRMPIM